HLGQDVVDAALEQLLGWDQVQPERPRAGPVLGPVETAPNPDLHRAPDVDQALLDGSLAPGPVRVSLTPIVFTGISVRVEVDQPDGSVARCHRPQLSPSD